jgi:hypothetical protein
VSATRWPVESNDMNHERSEERKRFELAPQDRMAGVEDLAPRFFREVVGWEYDEVLVTDESELSDFADVTADRKREVQVMLRRMESTYGLAPTAAKSTRIIDLLEFLAINLPSRRKPE